MSTTTFDLETARTRHDKIIKEVQWIRDGLTKDVVEYNYSKYPDSEEEEKHQREDMRKYLRIASERIHDLLQGKLY